MSSMFERPLVTVSLIQREGQRLVVTVAGEIDASSSDTLHSETLAQLDAKYTHLVLEFSKVTFCDSSGMSALIGIQRQMHQYGGTVAVAAAPHNVARALRIGGVDQLIPVYSSVSDAIKAMPEARTTTN